MVFIVLTAVLVLPLFSFYFLKIYQNQLIQQTEAELIAQGAALSAVFHREVETGIPQGVALGARVAPAAQKPPDDPTSRSGRCWNWPMKTCCRRARRPRAAAPADPAFVALGARMMPDLVATQNVTLAGFRLLDPNGIVIAGREEVGLSLAHLEEVGEALQGRFSGVLRVRISKHDQPSLYSMSRGTGMRVFTAMPVIVRDQVAGVIYASRTPSNVFKYLYEQRGKLLLAVLSMIVPTLLIGFLFHRTITGPMRELIERTNLVGNGDRNALRPLRHHGTSEFARLSQSFLEMARRLDTRSQLHLDLRHPCLARTEIAADLDPGRGGAFARRCRRADMDDEDRRKFLDNIIADTDRLAKISGRLRDFARAENPIAVGATKLSVADRRIAFGLRGARYRRRRRTRYADAHLGGKCQHHLFQSRRQRYAPWQPHARHLAALRQGNPLLIKVADDGEGVSPNNRAQIFDSFFTTRRDSGGTGMGLAIVRAMLDAHGGAIRLLESAQGTAFEITIPVADGPQP